MSNELLLELARNIAHETMIKNLIASGTIISEDDVMEEDDDCYSYKDEYQDIFDEYYDLYYTIIENTIK